jgi:NTE family protein
LKEYHKLADKSGAIIKKRTRIERTEDVHFLFEDADFSISTIKKVNKTRREGCRECSNNKAG